MNLFNFPKVGIFNTIPKKSSPHTVIHPSNHDSLFVEINEIDGSHESRNSDESDEGDENKIRISIKFTLMCKFS
jgi:hypothetical protein